VKIAKKKDKKADAEPGVEELSKPMMIVMPPLGASDDNKTPRCVGLIGEVTEEKASEVLYGMLQLRHTGINTVLVDEDKPDGKTKETYDPFEIMISTLGGSSADMFSIYDVMKLIQEEGMEIGTIGVGKVMSAGVLLLAAGAKGKRRIGKHCRVMIHGVSSGAGGHIQDLDNEMAEIKVIEEQYISSLAEETAMSKKYIKNLLKKKLNVYIGAEQAVELGIADTIF
jgi:ATP-dependent Clp endopeptidase proteolytic subunit ClpP